MNGTNGAMGLGNGVQEYQLAGAQRDIDMTLADRRKLEQLLEVARDHMEDTDDYTQRAMDRIGQNLKSELGHDQELFA